MTRFFVMTAVWIALASLSLFAQNTTTGHFVVRLGRDTIAVEQYSLSSHGLRGTSVTRSPKTIVRDFEAELGADGELQHFHVTLHPVGGPVTGERDYVYRGDSIEVTFKQDTMTRRSVTFAQGHPIPLFVDIIAPWEMALRHAKQKGNGREFGVLAGRQVLKYEVKGNPPGQLDLANPENDFSPIQATVNREGDVEKFDMSATTDKFVAERVKGLDVGMMAKEFSEREKSSGALGTLSPRDTVRAEIGGAHLLIDYGRPAARGRKIFGGVVPWDQVWRTGANAATQLVTDKELMFGATVVPPGTYSLFTLPTAHDWLLIVNRQHGQWGTVYDESKDLARLPLTVKHLPALKERFTFTIDSHDHAGTISFEWGDTGASIPFSVQR